MNAHKDDWRVAGYPVPPKSWLPLLVGRQHAGVGAEVRAGIKNKRRQPLEEVNVLGRNLQVAQLDLTMRPGQLEGADNGRVVVVLAGQGDGVLPRLGHGGRE